jgi:parallel beta-helix repeat protein
MTLFLPLSAYAGAQVRITANSIDADTVWSGPVLVEKPLNVSKGATLTVKPGTVARFKPGAGLNVEGVLKASGTDKSPVTFTSSEKKPARGNWTGITLNAAGAGTVISRCRVEYASSLNVSGCSPDIKDSEFVNGTIGIVPTRKSSPLIRRNRIKGMDDGGINCQMGSMPLLAGNTIEDCANYGITSDQEAQPTITGNTITRCGNGIILGQSVPPVTDNTVKGCKQGIALSTGSVTEIRGNRVIDNETGIICQMFSQPAVEKNLVKGNKVGIACLLSSNPAIKHNEMTGNQEAINAIQICNPAVTANSIHGNGRGVYLDMSSYATVNGNNIYDNKVQFELGNMSSDWERRINNKPIRGRQAQNFSKADRGKVVRQIIPDNAKVMGEVDATGNWWGESVTREMEKKGPDANINSFKDYYDVPTRTYDGYEGEYVQDRIKYDGWKGARIKDAGM